MLDELFELALAEATKPEAAKAVVDDELFCVSPRAYYCREATEAERLITGITQYSSAFKRLDISCTSLMNPRHRFSHESVVVADEAFKALVARDNRIVIESFVDSDNSNVYIVAKDPTGAYIVSHQSTAVGVFEPGVTVLYAPEVIRKHPEKFVNCSWRVRKVLNSQGGFCVLSTHTGTESLYLIASKEPAPELANARLICGNGDALIVGTFDTKRKVYKGLKPLKGKRKMNNKKTSVGTKIESITGLPLPPLTPAVEKQPAQAETETVEITAATQPTLVTESKPALVEEPEVVATPEDALAAAAEEEPAAVAQAKPKRQRKLAQAGAVFDYDAAVKYFETQPGDMTADEAVKEIRAMRDLTLLLARRITNISTKQIELLVAEQKKGTGVISAKKIQDAVTKVLEQLK